MWNIDEYELATLFELKDIEAAGTEALEGQL